jgi:hypothetical protein
MAAAEATWRAITYYRANGTLLSGQNRRNAREFGWR